MKRELFLSGILSAATVVALPMAPAQAAPATCNDKPVTIVANLETTQGTEGDDVVAMEPGEWNRFDALGGNDTICLAIGKGYGGRDVTPPTGHLDAGAGDDTVINLMPAGTKGAQTWVALGLGNDTFTGAGVGEVVYAETEVDDYLDPYGINPDLVGAQKDVITGASRVYTTAPNDGPNQDQITFGAGEAHAYVAGPMAVDGLLDFTAAREATLEVRAPSRLDPQADDLTINNQSRTISTTTQTALTWNGEVENFYVGAPSPKTQTVARVSFVGTNREESLTFIDTPIGDVDLAGGNDNVSVNSWNSPFIQRSADGGAGNDSISVDAKCTELVVRLDGRGRCDESRGTVSDFEQVFAGSDTGRANIKLIGTNKAEQLSAGGNSVFVDARGGADEVLATSRARTQVLGGAGSDDLRAGGDIVMVRGQGGADKILLGGSTRIRHAKNQQRVAFGGPGADRLFGSFSKTGDRLLGGPGHDIANGRGGEKDYCIAEVRRHCELP